MGCCPLHQGGRLPSWGEALLVHRMWKPAVSSQFRCYQKLLLQRSKPTLYSPWSIQHFQSSPTLFPPQINRANSSSSFISHDPTLSSHGRVLGQPLVFLHPDPIFHDPVFHFFSPLNHSHQDLLIQGRIWGSKTNTLVLKSYLPYKSPRIFFFLLRYH